MTTIPMTDVMVDLETWATSPDAAIISIGAVAFSLERCAVDTAQGFYRVLRPQHSRRISEETRQWWLQQSHEARAVLSTPTEQRVDRHLALEQLAEWAHQHGGEKLRWWSNGAAFDLAILTHAYSQCDLPLPWKWGDRCYRTYKNLPGARNVPMQRTGTHHNALDDAIDQARHLCAIHAHLFGGKTP